MPAGRPCPIRTNSFLNKIRPPAKNGARNTDSFDGNDASGHRARLRKRLMTGGEDALADHEVIEYLLMVARPRIDTKPIARSLIQRFGREGHTSLKAKGLI